MSKVTSAVAVVLVVALLAMSVLAIYDYTRRVDGISMLPTLEQGDLVVVQPVPITQVSLGDIIVYGPPCSDLGESVIHRTVHVAGNGFITKGDNNGLEDQSAGIANAPITQGCLEGKVIFVIPYLERLSGLPYGINYLLAVLIVLLVVYTEVGSWRSGRAAKADAEPQPTGDDRRDEEKTNDRAQEHGS